MQYVHASGYVEYTYGTYVRILCIAGSLGIFPGMVLHTPWISTFALCLSLHMCRCPGGEGIYAFSTKFASRVFELVQENISQGQPSNRTSSTNGTAEKYVKGPSRHQSASSGSTRRSPPAEFSGSLPSNRSQTLPASSAVSGSSLTSDSEVQQERQAVSKPSQATPQPQTAPTGGTSAETTPVQGPSKEAQKIEGTYCM